MSLKHKFLAIFIAITIIPVIIVTTFTYSRYTQLVNKQIIQVAQNVVDNATENANAKIVEVIKMTEIFQLYSPESYSIIEDIKKYKVNDGNYTVYDLWESRNNMMLILKSLHYSNNYVNGIFIFTPSGDNIGYGLSSGIDIKHGYKPFEDEWYKKTIEQNGHIHISNISKKDFILNSQESISFSRALYDAFTKEFAGVLLIDCTPDVLNISSSNTLPKNALLSIVHDDGNILYTNASDFDDIFTSSYSKNNIELIEKPLDQLNLKVSASIDLDSLYSEFNVTRFMIIGIALSIAVVFIVISIFLSNYLTQPIIILSKIMRNYNKKQKTTKIKYLNRNDEIGVLYNEYNNMIEEISSYIKEVYQNKLITLDSQMKSLEAQINSHFLYNTLESINSIAEIAEVENISIMSLALGDMFRYSIKTKSELVTIYDELKHVDNYISIQKIRFENRFKIIYDIQDSICNMKVLKLILQPIVENSILHGLNRCATKGTIKIYAFIENKNLFLEVSDDGVGMTTKQLLSIRELLATSAHFSELGRREKQSIGLKNIHSRIELYYGAGYGLSIESEESKGTVITLKLPLLESEV